MLKKLARMLLPDCVRRASSWMSLFAMFALLAPSLLNAQIVYRAATQARIDSVSAITVSAPAGVVSNDVLVASVAINSSASTVTAPSGWVLVLDTAQTSASVSRLRTYYKVATSSEPLSYAWSFSASGQAVVGIVAFAGVDTASPIQVSGGAATASSLTHSAPSVTALADNGVLITSHEFASASSLLPPAGLTEVVDVASPALAGATGMTLAMSYRSLGAAGATGTQTATGLADADSGAAHALVLRRASPVLNKVSSASAATQNSVVTFNVSLANPTTTVLNSIVVTDVLPASMTYVTSVSAIGDVAVSGQTLTWTIPEVAVGETVQWTIAVRLNQSGVLSNTASSNVSASSTASILSLTGSITHFKMDSPTNSWTGAVGEVLDSGGTNLHGRRITTSSPTTTNEVAPSPSIASQFASVNGEFCNAASFDRRGVVEVASSSLFDYTTQLSASAWIYPTAYPSAANGADLFSVLSNDQNYEFHINRAGKLYWWWNFSSLTSATTIPLNQWTHVAITFNSTTGQQRIYINGVADSNVGTWTGTLRANGCNFYVGGDVATGSCAVLPGRNFLGLIDEVKLYNTQLSAAQVQADMTIGRSCSGTFDHIRIEHDGSGSICYPETVTVKACQNASCSTLYPGDVQVQLSPNAGWTNGGSFTISGGVTTRQISQSTAGAVTLGTTSVSPVAGNATRCFSGSSETCTLNIASASCSFDAVEAGGAPKSRLFTKRAATAFNVDVLALTASGTVNAGYAGTVAVDLVDTSASDCPTGAGLTPAANVAFVSANSGRKSVPFTYANAAANVRVRMKVGSSAPACSTDNFSIRPSSLAVTTNSMTNATLSGTPKSVAGTVFPVTATSDVAAGYTGVPVIDETKVVDHNAMTIASGKLSGLFPAANGIASTGSAFKYQDVGSLRFLPDGVKDMTFTSVDQGGGDCISGSTSNVLSGGKFGCHIGSTGSAVMGRWYPSHYSFTGSLAGGCTAGGFTYMDQDALAASLTVKAHAAGSGAASSADPVVSRFTSGFAGLAAVTFTGDNAGALVAASRLTSPAFPTMPNTALWNAGQFIIADTFAFSKVSSPDGPYDSFSLKVAVSDGDGSVLIGSSSTAATKIRYGQLRMANAYGSELLALPVSVQALYWNGSVYAANTLDSCTSVNVSSIGMSDFTGNLAACETQLSPVLSQTMVAGKLPLVRLSKPGKGNSGSVLLTLNTSATASGSTCLSTTASSATAGNRPWFGSSPTARATFGVYSSPLIYLRENY